MDYKVRMASRIDKFGSKRKEIEEKIEALSGIEQEFMVYLYATMPLSDVANYEFETFMDYVSHAARLYQKTTLDKEMFMMYVLYHRVNNESITKCRTFFYQEVLEEIGEVPYSIEGILKANYFCASHVTYRASDDRTSAPIAVYEKGHGRCGEESVFTCSVLRSLGIASRQVYAKWWSHCDDNHAWVEIWIDGKWQFLGACEPEEVLNKGWFLNASSRAMLIHHKTFGAQNVSGDMIVKKDGVYLYNELERYAKTKEVEFIVQDPDGQSIEATIHIGVINYSAIRNHTAIHTKNGKAIYKTGYGSLMISVYQGEWMYEACVDVTDVDQVVVELYPRTYEKSEFLFIAPKDSVINSGAITKEQREVGNAKLKEAVEQRTNRNRPCNPIADLPVTATLLEKDLSDTKREDLIVHEQVENMFKVDEEIFLKYVVCPRIYFENITPYKQYIQEYFDENMKHAFIEQPVKVWEFIEERIKACDEEEYEELFTTPQGILEVGYGSALSQKILFVAILRSIGVPARLNPMNLEMEYYKDGAFVPVIEETMCKLTLNLSEETKWEYNTNITISKFDGEEYIPLELSEEQLGAELYLPIGEYKIVTSNRTPKGDIWVQMENILLDSREGMSLDVQQSEVKLSDMLSENKLEDFEVELEGGDKTYLSEISNLQLLIWLEPSKEPTEHILNELYDFRDKFASLNILFLLPSKEAKEDKNISRILTELPHIQCVYEEDTAETVARRMYVNPEALPLVVLVENQLIGRYAVSGYNVGTAEMLLKLKG